VRTLRPYKIGLLTLLLFSMLACRDNSHKPLNRRVTLWYKDKIPYGTYVAYENLSYIFPDAEIKVNQKLSDLYGTMEGKKVMIAIVHTMDPDSLEMSSLMDFIGKGNQVFISAFYFKDSLLRSLGIRLGLPFGYANDKDSLQLSVYTPLSADSLSFSYPGDSYDNFVSKIDTQYTSVLGRDARGRPNLVRINYKGGGALYLHFAPLAFSNFFLLHKNNKAYYDNVMSYLPSSAREVIWDQYFRYSDRNSGSFSALGYILNNRALRWAFWLLLLLFLLIYLFDSKRKQRIVPVIEPLRNSSVDFVKTIGRLYYQRRDNYNLAQKMVAHFQDHVRRKYNLQASVLDDAFVDRLTYKTGLPKDTVKDLVYDMNRFPHQGWLTDQDLMEFNHKMEEFYKQA
jgi:hypothetical protein